MSDHIWQIAEDKGVYCTLVKGSELAVLIDTGYGKRNLRAFIEKLISSDIKANSIKREHQSP